MNWTPPNNTFTLIDGNTNTADVLTTALQGTPTSTLFNVAGLVTGNGTNLIADFNPGTNGIPTTFQGTINFHRGSVSGSVTSFASVQLVGAYPVGIADYNQFVGGGSGSGYPVALQGTILNSGTIAINSNLTVSIVQYASGSNAANYGGCGIAFTNGATFAGVAAVYEQDSPPGWLILDRKLSVASNAAFIIFGAPLAANQDVTITAGGDNR
jgi:hypothetical protein